MQPADILAISSLSELSPKQLLRFIELLIAHETKPGGPYKFNSDDDTKLNTKLNALLKDTSPQSTSTRPTQAPTKTSACWETILNEAKPFFPNDSPARAKLSTLVSHLKQTDASGEISSLSTMFYQSLKPQLKEQCSSFSATPDTTIADILSQLDKANVFIWVAYSIYDSILDDKKSVELLPFANHVSNQALSMYLEVSSRMPSPSSAQSSKAILHLFSLVHIANSQEFEQNNKSLRVKNKAQHIDVSRTESIDTLFDGLANRSIIHCVGPLLLSHLFFTSSAQLSSITKAFSQYCAARQLLDDIHDWREDIRAGHMTYVVARLLTDASIKPGAHPMAALVSILSKQCFDSTAHTLLQETEQLAKNAQETLERILLRKNSPFSMNYLAPLSRAARSGSTSHEFNRQFLKMYAKSQSRSSHNYR